MSEDIPTRSRGDRYAISALRNKRASLASEVVETERRLRHLREALGHVDATLKLLDPSIRVDAIPNKRPTRRIKLFRSGELGRMILGVLRDAPGPLPTVEIVNAILATGGHGEEARKAVAPRIRGNLAYLERRGKVVKEGEQREARWRTVADGA